MKRLVFALVALSLVSGCSVFKGKDKAKTPTIGRRISVLAPETSVAVDPDLATLPIQLPAVTVNDAWVQPGGIPSKSMGHLALGQQLQRAWSVSIGQGSSNREKLGAAPVVADGRVYTVDTTATVRAFDAKTGASLWERPIGTAEARKGGSNFLSGEATGSKGLLFGGGVSYAGGKVYATSGLGDVVALDAATGEQAWLKRPGGPLRGAPTVAQDTIYLTSQDNQLFALDQATGETRWIGAGTLELAGVFGTSAPAAAAGTVVAGFSSGELTAYRYENGRVVWQDALARTSISIAVASLSDIDAEPVIDNGRVYAIGLGGRMVALELSTGQRIWELNIDGIATPWVAGDWIYVVSDSGQLFALARATGKAKWMTQLREWRNQKSKNGVVTWYGPLLAGDRLVLVNSLGEMVNVSPNDGTVQSTIDTKLDISLPPVVANSTLYLLSDDGRLSAWR